MLKDRLRKLRELKGYSQKDFAIIIGIPYHRYNKYETTNSEPDIDTLKKMAELLNVSIACLLGVTDNQGDQDVQAQEALDMFSERLRESREALGISKTKMAEMLGIDRTRYEKWEQGIAEPSISLIKKIAEILNVSADYLLDVADDPISRALKEPPQQERPTPTEETEGTVEFIDGEEFERLVGIDYEDLQQLIEEAVKKEFDKRNQG